MKKHLSKIVLWSVSLLLLLIIGLIARGFYAFRDRSPGYRLDVSIDPEKSRAEPRALRVGFAREKINPDLSDPKRPIWLAGFGPHRAATAIHDDLWAVAMVLDDGHSRFGLVALDAIGFFHDDVVAVRRRCAAEWKLDYTVICSVHNHSTPDLMGLWGPNALRTGVDARYREKVIRSATKALGDAVSALQPARVAFHQIPVPSEGLVMDTRAPIVFDPDVRVMHFTSTLNGATLGTVVGWANHPETPWRKNTEVTADFCGYLRQTLESGFTNNGRVFAEGLGGIHLFVNGALGGLLWIPPTMTVRDPFMEQDYTEPTHNKSRAVAHQLASRILPEISKGTTAATDFAPIGIRARTFEMPVRNWSFMTGQYLGVMDRGQVRWATIRTEAALVTIGEASIACVPGEIYPEIVNGGIERPAGADLQVDAMEVPPLRDLMPGSIKFVFGLANDELGYLIPKSQWDVKPPYLNGATRAPYGEHRSCGPDAGRLVYVTLADLCRESKGFVSENVKAPSP
jgi:hypothetical protein